MSTEGVVGLEQQAGKELHREFVGMLFALAIAEVAVAAAAVASAAAKHELAFTTVLPAYTHLFLAAIVISTSWVGWGSSKASLGFVTSVFSKAFVELLLDVWLVIAYFFLVKGVETVQIAGDGVARIAPSLRADALWVTVIFVTYALWDAWTKLAPRSLRASLPSYKKRGWASIACALLALIALLAFWNSTSVGAFQAVFGDLSLLALVLVFRAMKLADFGDFVPWQRRLIASLTVAFALLMVAAIVGR